MMPIVPVGAMLITLPWDLVVLLQVSVQLVAVWLQPGSLLVMEVQLPTQVALSLQPVALATVAPVTVQLVVLVALPLQLVSQDAAQAQLVVAMGVVELLQQGLLFPAALEDYQGREVHYILQCYSTLNLYCSLTGAGLTRKRDAPTDVAGILLKFMEHTEEMETRRMQEKDEREERQREQERKEA